MHGLVRTGMILPEGFRMQVDRAAVAIFATLTLMVAAASAAGDTVAVSRVAISRQAASGSSGLFQDFQRPLINDAGQVAFIADTTAVDGGMPASHGIWLGRDSMTLNNVVQSGQDAPGTGAQFSTFTTLRLNDVGQVAFGASTGNDTTFSTGGIFSASTSGPPVAIALRSSITGATLWGFNNLGQASVVGADSSGNSTTVWVGSSTASLAPAASLGASMVFGNVPLTAAGALSFAHNLTNASDGSPVTIGYEVLAGQASAVTTLIVRGPAEPVSVGSMNAAGQVAFGAADRLWIGKLGTGIAPVVGPASAVPDVAGASFDSIGLPAINHGGTIAFRADIAGAGVTSSNGSGIWSGEDADSLRLIVRTGQPVPNSPGFVIASLGTPQINATGQMIFAATVSGAGGADDSAIFGYDPAAGLMLLVRAGDSLQVGPGDLLHVSSVSLDGSASDGADSAALAGGEDGLGSNLNDAGQFTFLAALGDGTMQTSGVFVASVPEPSAFAALALACGLIARLSLRRRRSR